MSDPYETLLTHRVRIDGMPPAAPTRMAMLARIDQVIAYGNARAKLFQQAEVSDRSTGRRPVSKEEGQGSRERPQSERPPSSNTLGDDGYFCGSNFCDDPACTGEHPELL